MSSESSQKWLERNRPPRVQISYDVETGGASAKRELPMVVGILADLGANDEPVPKRRFIEIDRDNFDQVMKTISPSMQIKGISGLCGKVGFKKLEHFEPDYLVQHVTGLNELFEQRQQLRDLMAKIDGNDRLHKNLADAVTKDKTFAEWGVKLGDGAVAPAGAALATLTAAELGALAPEALAAYGEALGTLSTEQRAGLTPAQIEALPAELRALLQPKD